MEIITIIMITLAMVIYLARFFIRAPGADWLAGIVGMGAIALTVADKSIADEFVRLVLCLPPLYTTLISFSSLAFGKAGKETRRKKW